MIRETANAVLAKIDTYDVDNLVVLSALVSGQVVLELVGVLGNVGALGSIEVLGHAGVVREQRRGSTDFSTHVANSRLTSARDGLDTGTGVLNDGASSALDGEDASNLENNVCKTWSNEHATTSIPISTEYTPFGVVQPEILPVRLTPITLGHLSSQGMPAMTSTASAPPTPQATIPRPPALGVCESVPIINPPGKA